MNKFIFNFLGTVQGVMEKGENHFLLLTLEATFFTLVRIRKPNFPVQFEHSFALEY